MTLSDTITTRYRRSGGRDPDTLHGLLFITERGAETVKIGHLIGCPAEKMSALLEKARTGQCGRVPSVSGAATNQGEMENLPGLIGRQWKRDLIALMLKAGGGNTYEVREALGANANSLDPGEAISVVRDELKIFGISITAAKIEGSPFHRWQIIGMDAWRMQKIIANGWAL